MALLVKLVYMAEVHREEPLQKVLDLVVEVVLKLLVVLVGLVIVDLLDKAVMVYTEAMAMLAPVAVVGMAEEAHTLMDLVMMTVAAVEVLVMYIHPLLHQIILVVVY